MLEGGALTIRRTAKPFSRTPVDLTLEQTINADAASRHTGIAAFTNSNPARRRWMLTRSVRSGIVGSLLHKAGLKRSEDVSQSLKPYRVKKDNDDLRKLTDKIENTMNPFEQEHDDNLYCITTGKQVGNTVKNDMLNCIEIGNVWQAEFANGCFSDQLRFEKPIKLRKVRNFASEAVKAKVNSKDKKILEIQGTRDLFGRLLYVSTMGNIDLSKVFAYPLVPVPLSIGHIDGLINKTDNSKLMHKLEKNNSGPAPEAVDVTLVDGMFMGPSPG